MESKFNNAVTVIGKPTNKEIKDFGSGLGEVYVRAGQDSVKFQKWNDDYNPTAGEDLVNGLEVGKKYQIQGNMSEREFDGSIFREVKPWNNIKEVGEDVDEKAVIGLSGDVYKLNMSYPQEVLGFEYEGEAVPKFDFKLLLFNNYNKDTKENDLTRQQVLINTIEYYGDKCKKDGIDANFDQLTKWLETLEDGGVAEVYDIYEKLKKTSCKLYKMSEITLTALGDIGQEMADNVVVGDNITLGAFIENRMNFVPIKRDFFGNPLEGQKEQDNSQKEAINRIRVDNYSVNEKTLSKKSKKTGW